MSSPITVKPPTRCLRCGSICASIYVDWKCTRCKFTWHVFTRQPDKVFYRYGKDHPGGLITPPGTLAVFSGKRCK